MRGINVGASTRVPMAGLRAALEDEGAAGARTHLQSGNVLLDVPGTDDDVGALVARAVRAVAALDVDVVVRSPEQLAELVAADPLGDVADDPSRRFVVFLGGPVEPGALEEVRTTDWGPERLVLREREVVLWCPAGVRDSRLARALAGTPTTVPVTMRNWRTTSRLAGMTGGG